MASDIGVVVLIASVLFMMVIFGYEAHRGMERIRLLGGVLVYLGILPLFILNAFDVAATAERASLIIGACSLLVGLALLWNTN